MLISTFLFYLFIFLMAEGWLQYMFFFFLDSICRRYMIVMHDTLSVPALLYCVGIFRLFGIFCMIFICRVCLSMPVLLWGSCNCHFCCNENEFLYYSALSKPGFNLYPYFFPLSLLCINWICEDLVNRVQKSLNRRYINMSFAWNRCCKFNQMQVSSRLIL